MDEKKCTCEITVPRMIEEIQRLEASADGHAKAYLHEAASALESYLMEANRT